ncbi:MAG: RNA polymerase subunit sigma-70 [Chloroflexi bacterium]|nr:MAG: RNA polymerase subunit sigma-70 [Chloroflexota bacterium]
MSNQNDEQIIAQIVSGDVDAYKELYQRYASSVLGLSYRIVGNREQAEEIVQETFWRVWQNASSFNAHRGSITNWMFGIARNLSIDVIRKEKKVTMESLPDAHSEQAESSPHLKADHNVPEAAWSLLQQEQVLVALAELPTEQRNVVEWIYFQGKTRREIAQEFGIPFGTINTRAKLALQKLKRAFEGTGLAEEFRS